MPTHKGKLKKFLDVEISEDVNVIVEDYNLLSLVDYSLTMLNGQLLMAFVERRHKETYSFHLSFGEMMITLDDVSYVFHLTLAGSFFTASLTSQKVAHITIVQDLRVTEEQVTNEFRTMRGAHFRISWLRDRYKDLVHQGMYEEATSVYMLNLVGSTILADKSHVHIDAACIFLFSRLEHYN